MSMCFKLTNILRGKLVGLHVKERIEEGTLIHALTCVGPDIESSSPSSITCTSSSIWWYQTQKSTVSCKLNTVYRYLIFLNFACCCNKTEFMNNIIYISFLETVLLERVGLHWFHLKVKWQYVPRDMLSHSLWFHSTVSLTLAFALICVYKA